MAVLIPKPKTNGASRVTLQSAAYCLGTAAIALRMSAILIIVFLLPSDVDDDIFSNVQPSNAVMTPIEV
jgi:hypothetical protein